MNNENTANETMIANAETENGHFSLAFHIVLLLFGSPIWYLYWIYHITKYLNLRLSFGRKPVTIVLLSLFLPFYTAYWTYKAAQQIDRLGERYKQQKICVLCLIFQLFSPVILFPYFFPIVSPILMQNKLNSIFDAKKEPVPQDTSADDLKKYKSLLDDGAITEEEYHQIKAHYLNKFKNES